MSVRIPTRLHSGALPSMLPVVPQDLPATRYVRGSNAASAVYPRVRHSLLTRLVQPLPITTPLEAALDSVDAERIKADLFWVAADARGGRGTPSQGQSETADYLENRVRDLGWKSGTQDGTYRHKYQLWGGWFDLESTHISLGNGTNSHTFTPEKDYFYTSLHKSPQSQEISGSTVFVGEATAEIFDHNNIKGKWAIVYDSNVNPVAQRKMFKAAGAAGLIIIPGPESSRYLYERKIHDQIEHYRTDDHSATDCHDDDCEKNLDEIMFTAEAAEKLLSLLTTPEFLVRPNSPRFPGTTFLHNSAMTSTSLEMKDERNVLPNPFKVEAENVAAFWEGSDPELSKEVIVLTAHYDHLGTKGGTVYNGSDDNGSGTVGLMAMAEAIAKLNPKRSIMLLWVSGEEKGLLGSAAWVKDFQKNPRLPNGGKLVANINMDMISRNDPTQFSITPSPRHKRHNVIVKTATALAAQEGFTQINSGDQYYSRSDQYNFSEILDLPVAFLTVDEHEDHHRPTDDPEKGDYDKIRRISRLFVRTINALDDVRVIE